MLFRRWTGWAAATPPPYPVRVLLVPLAPVILVLAAPYLLIRWSLLSSPAALRGLVLLVLFPVYLPSYVLCRVFRREFMWVVNGFNTALDMLKGGRSSRSRCINCCYQQKQGDYDCPFCFEKHAFLGFGEFRVPYDPDYIANRGRDDTS